MKRQLTKEFPKTASNLTGSSIKIGKESQESYERPDSYEEPNSPNIKEIKENIPEAEIPEIKTPMVHVDHRESKSGVVRELSNLGVKIKTATLTVADYQISVDVAVERKKCRGFCKLNYR